MGRIGPNHPDDAVQCAPTGPCAPGPAEGAAERAPSNHIKKETTRPLCDACAVDWGELRNILSDSGGSEADFDRRVGILAALVDFSNMRDWHPPFAMVHPAPQQYCAKCARGA